MAAPEWMGLVLTVAGNSFGALFALHWAALRSDVERVVCVSAPVYAGTEEADVRFAYSGPAVTFRDGASG